jgi:hypothetical protein
VVQPDAGGRHAVALAIDDAAVHFEAARDRHFDGLLGAIDGDQLAVGAVELQQVVAERHAAEGVAASRPGGERDALQVRVGHARYEQEAGDRERFAVGFRDEGQHGRGRGRRCSRARLGWRVGGGRCRGGARCSRCVRGGRDGWCDGGRRRRGGRRQQPEGPAEPGEQRAREPRREPAERARAARRGRQGRAGGPAGGAGLRQHVPAHVGELRHAAQQRREGHREADRQVLAHVVEAAVDPALHRADRARRRVGDLGRRHAVHEVQRHHFALRHRQPGDRLVQAGGQFVGGDRFGWAVRREAVCDLDAGAFALQLAPAAARDVDQDADQPRLERALAVVPIGLLDRRQERLLQQVLRLLAGAGDVARDQQQLLGDAVEHRRQRGEVAFVAPAQEGRPEVVADLHGRGQ